MQDLMRAGVRAVGLSGTASTGFCVLMLTVVGMMFVGSASAAAETARPAWMITGPQAPSVFVPGDQSGTASYLVTLTNIGGAATDGSPITLTDTLPTGLSLAPRGIEASPGVQCSGATVITCEANASVPPGGVLTMIIPVDIASSAPPEVTNIVSVQGGGAAFSSAAQPTAVSTTSAAFGVQRFDAAITNANGDADTQAGSHPYEMTTVIDFNTFLNPQQQMTAVGSPRDLAVSLPPGLVANPQSVSQCTTTELRAGQTEFSNGCPLSSQVGVVSLRGSSAQRPNGGFGVTAVYNMVPPPGVPAEFGFQFANVPVLLAAHADPETGYAATVVTNELSAAVPFTSTQLTLWGDPADPSHDDQRCPEIPNEQGGICPGGPAIESPHGAGTPPAPFLTLPSSCAGPQTMSLSTDSWQQPGTFVDASLVTHDQLGEAVGFDGCQQLAFGPSLSAQPETTAADSPTGLNVDLALPALEGPAGLAESDLKTVTTTLPAGLTLNPSAATGLAACTPEEIALSNSSAATCPDASRVGTSEVHSPLLKDPLKGSVYVAQPFQNPFGSLFAIYVTAEGDGVHVKLAGQVEANASTGQLTTTFSDNPQLPFSDLKLSLFGGSDASLATPQTCGTLTTESMLESWAGSQVLSNSPFNIDTQCAATFAPTLTAASENPVAGAYTPFRFSFARSDSDRELSGLSVSLPNGLLAKIAGVPLCADAEANVGSCPAASQIGHVTVGAGAGSSPFFLPGQVYLTGPYNGGPFGIAVVVRALAGPFDLGTVVVRSSIRIDPHDAHVTVVSDPFPTILDGVPLRLRQVKLVLDRPDFDFNPTSCEQQAIGTSFTSTEGSTFAIAPRFQVGDCRDLEFHPRFTVSTFGKASRANGASLDVNVAANGGPQLAGGGEANIRSVKVSLPRQLPSRLTTLQKACLASVFEANPASCPKESDVGTATAKTPILAQLLTGPAYLVSHGGAAFPDLEIVLQGEGIKLVLDGHTDIKKGITTSTFNTIPDAPISSFELKLPTGPFSVLGAYVAGSNHYKLCGQSLSLPTTITAQNGAVITQATKLGVTGCPPTRAQKLAAAMKVCHKKAKGKRVGCEQQARRKYGPLKKKK